MTDSSLQEIVCCIGRPVGGNPTQFIMERAFAAAGLEWRYLTLEVAPENLEDAVRGMKALGFRGGNITLPHRVEVVRHLDGLSDAAERIGAVNCVYRENDQLIGENTDGKAFLQSLRPLLDPAGKKIVLFGAGGAARAIAVELAVAGAQQITVANREEESAQDLAALLHDHFDTTSRAVTLDADLEIEPDTELLINATSIGLGDPEARVPLNSEGLQAGMVVADVIVNPPRTRLLREAAARGCRTLDGLGMLVHQRALAFQIWTTVEPDPDVMREALEEYLEL